MKFAEEEKRKRKRRPKLFLTVTFFCAMAIIATLALMLPLRPTYSETEKRELSKFPKFSVSALFDGSYFDQIELWYSDTFPGRDKLLDINSGVKSLYGVGNEVNKLNGEVADEIPDPVPLTETPTTAEATTEGQTNVPPTTKEAEESAVNDSLVQKLGAVLIVDDTGYEYYNFVRSEADKYAAAVSKTASVLAGQAKVYDIVVPTSMDITLADSVRSGVNSSDQKKAINYIYGSMPKNVTVVPIFDTLRAHRSEYIYFRTDHHWTALGAYYAYCDIINAAGKTPALLESYDEKQYDGFLGAFYADTKKNKALEKSPDTVHAYAPRGNVKLEFTDKKGNVVKWNVVTDVSKWNASSKYSTFIGGDNPYTKIVNHDITDGSSCLVIKESFGNALIPFLTSNYNTVHVIDYRYWSGSIASFAKEKGVGDVFYLNNVSATRSESLVNKIVKISK